MSLMGNLLWIVLGGGIFVFFFYFLGGLVLCLTVVGIPLASSVSNWRCWGSCLLAAELWNARRQRAAWRR